MFEISVFKYVGYHMFNYAGYHMLLYAAGTCQNIKGEKEDQNSETRFG
jgi:hypothetical protein